MTCSFLLSPEKWKNQWHSTNSISYLGSKEIIQYDDQLSRPYNLTYVDLTSNSVKLLFYFNETNYDPRRQIQKLEVKISFYLLLLKLNVNIII